MPIITVSRELKQEDWRIAVSLRAGWVKYNNEFWSRLGYRIRSCPKQNKTAEVEL